MSVGFVERGGCRIVSMDFARLRDVEKILAGIGRAFVAAQPKRKELLTLVDVTDLPLTERVFSALHQLAKDDEPSERAVAVCGLTGLGEIIFRAQKLLAGGRLRGFRACDDALQWLVQRAPEK